MTLPTSAEPSPSQTLTPAATDMAQPGSQIAGGGTAEDAVLTLALEWDTPYKAAFGLPTDAPVDYAVFLAGLHPDDRTRVAETISAAVAQGEPYEAECRVVLPDGSHRWLVARGAASSPGVLVDITAGRETQEALRERGEFLHRVLASSPDCIKTLDLDGNLVGMTQVGQQIMEVDDFSALCGVEWLTFWNGDYRESARIAIETAKAGGMGRFQGFCPTMKGTPRWWDVVVAPVLGADGKPEQLLSVSRDITDQKVVEERERTRLTDIFMRAPAFMAALRGPDHTYELANLPYYRLIGRQEEFATQSIIGKTVAEVLPEVVEQGFIGLLDQVYQTGEAYVGTDSRVVFQLDAGGSADEHFVDFTFQPLYNEDSAVSGILVHGIDLTARKRLEQEREQLLSETRAQAERESLLNQIGTAVRTLLEPEAILQAIVSLLGQGLRVDRCYFVRYNQARDTARVSPEWYRPEAGIQPLAGRTFQISTYSVDRDSVFKSGQTHAVDDVIAYEPEDAAPLLSLNVRALLRVPIAVGDHMTTLTVAMAQEARCWTVDEILFVENVATLVRSALESAQTQTRERNIARQLQEALQPLAPPDLPGLALASFYRPALSEASVGGDFFDVFSVEKGCTALVVADLSGKGLAAAQQVATVRNMLRFALYTGTTVAEAINTLHHNLVEHDLLTGFATLFVGVYDQALRTLTYVNCGQEPGLIWRSGTDQVEQLPPTGPVLGGFASVSSYHQKTVSLSSHDVLAVFTDGLTEVGPSRKQFLETEGVSDLLRECCAAGAATPQGVIDSLIANVDFIARGGIPDDMALLVGVAA